MNSKVWKLIAIEKFPRLQSLSSCSWILFVESIAGQAGPCRPEESQVPPGGGGSPDLAGGLQLVEEQQIL